VGQSVELNGSQLRMGRQWPNAIRQSVEPTGTFSKKSQEVEEMIRRPSISETSEAKLE
jgi:hypothetical protein